MAEEFNPAEYTAEAVLEHLREADPAEQARVLDLERSGPARVTVLRFGENDPALDPNAVPGEINTDPSGYTREVLPVDGTTYPA